MKSDNRGDDRLVYNKNIHDLLAPLYERRHAEIFNPTEQRRIHSLLKSNLQKYHGHGPPQVLDFGAGTGNLTRHFLHLGASVVAADVSIGILNELISMTGRHPQLKTMTLNGCDLCDVPSDSFDMVAAYSVLHHVPDYLAIVDEFVRVAKPGAIIYIDHEVCPTYWEDKAEYLEYCLELAEFQKSRSDNILRRAAALLTRKGCWRYIWSMLRLKGAHILDDGDIHVFKHDHIEWPAIREHLRPFCDIVTEEDYLVCRESQDPPCVWPRWQDRCVDMRSFVAQKR